MLRELITYLTTPCSPHIRGLGYLYETIAMRGRFERNQVAWQPHLNNSRAFMLSAAERCRNKKKIVILGSGLLLDVPLAELSTLFHEVVLLDVVCLPDVRKQIRTFNNVKFFEHDVTGITERLFRNRQSRIPELPDSAPASASLYEHADMVVSLNVLSQIWVIPRDYALTHLRGLQEDQVEDWCAQLVAAHYAFLRLLPCDVCLVADTEFTKRDRAGRIFSKGSTIAGLVLPAPEATWTWNIVPPGEDDQFASKELKVGGWNFF